MVMDWEKWHDGIGYDLEALDALDAHETAEVVQLLIGRIDGAKGDWYDLEALYRIGTPEARAALIAALRNSNATIRLHAAEYLAEEDDADSGLSKEQKEAVEQDIAGLLKRPNAETGIDLLTRLAEQFDSPVVREALLWCAMDGREDLRVHAAALALYLAGGAPEAFDWEQRPLFLEFGEADRKVRETAMAELLRRMEAAKK